MRASKEEIDQTYNKVLRVVQQLRDYKRQRRREVMHKLFLIACIGLLVAVMATGFDTNIRHAFRDFVDGENALAK